MSKLAPCLMKLSVKYLKSERASRGSLVVINLVPSPKSFLQRKILEAINEDRNHSFGVMVKDGRLKHLNASAWGVTDKAQSYLLLMLVINDLDVTLKQWESLPTWNPLAKTVIVLMHPIETNEDKSILVKQVLERLLEKGIMNANVLYQMKSDDSKMVAETWFPYLNSSCASTVENIFMIDECVVTEIVDEDTKTTVRKTSVVPLNVKLFPKIPSTFHGCPMKVSLFIWEPFVVSSEDSEDNLAGIEIQMLKTITNQMDLEINYKFLDKKILAAKISGDNQSGIYADLLQK